MPVAARLATGVPLPGPGDPIDATSLVTLPRPQCRVVTGAADAEVVTVDVFGSAQLSLAGAVAVDAGFVPETVIALAWDGNQDDPHRHRVTIIGSPSVSRHVPCVPAALMT